MKRALYRPGLNLQRHVVVERVPTPPGKPASFGVSMDGGEFAVTLNERELLVLRLMLLAVGFMEEVE